MKNILFYVAYQGALQPPVCCEPSQRAQHKEPSIRNDVPPVQAKLQHFLHLNVDGDLALQSWFSWMCRLTFLQAPPSTSHIQQGSML